MRFKLKYLVFSLAILVFGTSVNGQDAKNLLKKMDELMLAPKDKQGTVKIILTNKSGKEKIREAELKQKGKDYRLYRYTQPESQAGIATLSLPDNVMWMYMPAFGKPKKISLLAKSQTFTGTDFSYEDMESKPYTDRYSAILEAEGEEAYTIELRPISEKSKYLKIILTLNKLHFYPQQLDFYDRGDKHFKTAIYKYKKGDPYWYAEEVVMTDHKKQHSTSIVMENVLFDQNLSDDDFAVENLAPKKEDETKEEEKKD